MAKSQQRWIGQSAGQLDVTTFKIHAVSNMAGLTTRKVQLGTKLSQSECND